MDPASIAFAALAEEYRRAERYQEAIDTCTAGLVRHPSYLSARVTLGRALLEVGRLQEAQQELEFVLKLAPENLAAIRGLAEIHHRLGDDHEHQALEAPVLPPPEPRVALSTPSTSAELVADKAPDQQIAGRARDGAVEQQVAALEQFLVAIQRARAARAAVR
jgi:tetratricopeptide (TPR) repeat protein